MITIKENVSLQLYTTFKVGGPARYFVEVSSVEELAEAVNFAKEKKQKILLLGGGSNILVSDKGWQGLVIHNRIMGRGWIDHPNHTVVTLGAGEPWDEVVAWTVENGWSGLENLSLIPGTVGATPVQNIGAYGIEIQDVLEKVEVYDTEAGTMHTFTRKDCEFAYRSSVFKSPGGKKYSIVRVSYRLNKKFVSVLDYKGISEYLEDHKVKKITAKAVRKAIIAIRESKLPNVNEVGTAGSFFKNPIISSDLYEKLLEAYSGLPGYRLSDELVKVPAAWLIEHVCDMKSLKIGGAEIYDKHALVVINNGNAKAADIYAMKESIIKCIHEKTKIKMQPEVQLIGSF